MSETADRPARSTVSVASPRGGTLVCDVAGSGPAVLLVHGIGGNRGQWRAVMDRLAANATLIAPDLAGYGDSDAPPVATFGDFAVDIEAILEALADGPAVAAGHSMGGRILMQTVAYDASLFCALALSATEPAFLAHMSPSAREAGIARRLAMFDGGRVSPEQARAIAEELVPPPHEEARAVLAASLVALREPGYRAALAASAGMDERALMSALPLPVAVLSGEHDRVCPPAAAHGLAATIGTEPAIILEGVGHMPHLEAPDRVAYVILSLLEEIHGPADPDTPSDDDDVPRASGPSS